MDWTSFSYGVSVGGVLMCVSLAALAYTTRRRKIEASFEATEARIEKNRCDLAARNAAGCRRIVPPQGGSGTAPPTVRPGRPIKES